MNMKIKTTKLLLLLGAVVIQLSCAKDKGVRKDDVGINEKNLTECPKDSNCKYYFSDNADLNDDFSLKSGDYKMFWNETTGQGITSRIYVKVPLNAKSFSYDKTAFFDGRVMRYFSCPSCYMVELKTIGGFVKGVNLTPDKPSDQSKWLLEAQVILGSTDGAVAIDTVKIKQYFYPNFIHN